MNGSVQLRGGVGETKHGTLSEPEEGACSSFSRWSVIMKMLILLIKTGKTKQGFDSTDSVKKAEILKLK